MPAAERKGILGRGNSMCKGLKMCQCVWVWVGVGILPEFGGWGPWGVGVAFLKAVKETTDFEVFLVTALLLGPPNSALLYPPAALSCLSEV